MQQRDMLNPFPEDTQQCWHKIFPILGHIKNYSSGLFLWMLLLALLLLSYWSRSIAYARLAGLPSEIGMQLWLLLCVRAIRPPPTGSGTRFHYVLNGWKALGPHQL